MQLPFYDTLYAPNRFNDTVSFIYDVTSNVPKCDIKKMVNIVLLRGEGERERERERGPGVSGGHSGEKHTGCVRIHI